MENRTIRIPKAYCNLCAVRIRQAFFDLKGAVEVKRGLGDRTFTFRWHSPANWAIIRDRLDQLGYSPERQIGGIRI